MLQATNSSWNHHKWSVTGGCGPFLLFRSMIANTPHLDLKIGKHIGVAASIFGHLKDSMEQQGKFNIYKGQGLRDLCSLCLVIWE